MGGAFLCSRFLLGPTWSFQGVFFWQFKAVYCILRKNNNKNPWNGPSQKGNVIFHPPIFRGYHSLLVSGRVFVKKKKTSDFWIPVVEVGVLKCHCQMVILFRGKKKEWWSGSWIWKKASWNHVFLPQICWKGWTLDPKGYQWLSVGLFPKKNGLFNVSLATVTTATTAKSGDEKGNQPAVVN